MPCHKRSVRTAVGQKEWARRCLLATAIVCVVAAITAQSALAATTVALWHMNEKSGTVMHDSASNHNGTLHNITLGLPGFRGLAYGFNGSSSYVSVPSAGDLNPGPAKLTVTIHFKTTSLPGRGIVWTLIRKGHWNTRGGEWKVRYNHSGEVSCGFKGSRRYAVVKAGSSLNNNQWHTIRCVKTSSAIRLTLDGVTHSKASRVGSIANRAPVVIGAYPLGGFFNGSLDEARIAIG
ncbi:MAG: LamG-like jellyroll fold domain-containing protein [Solirubrobacteraceae bacterium]